ncbi:MAG: MarR family winged helix-turn-helix transcriptional regulator [Gammaproteobacteria bacterium]
MSSVVDLRRILVKRDAIEQARAKANKHAYFVGVAEARYVVRRAFRIVEERAKSAGIDPLAHQVLVQIYGSAAKQLPVNQIAERLDISPAFASNLVKALVKSGYAARRRDATDQRVTLVSATDEGKRLLAKIDEDVRFHVDYFTSQLSREEKESALSILLFYVGLSGKNSS